MPHAPVSSEVLEQIAQAIHSLRYGTVQITVHDDRVVQIEKHERIRLVPATHLTGGRATDVSPTDPAREDHRRQGR